MNNALLIFGGAANLLLALFHMAFWKFFDWPASLAPISLDNRAIIQVANLHLILIIGAFAYVSFYYRRELVSSGIGRAFVGTVASFYILRAANQFIFWEMANAESIVIVVLSLIIAAAYAVPFLTSRRLAAA